ncbi:MAG: response regulator [Sedimenticola sp.]|nr:response regulator [Sedimenticola sp.]
MAMDTLLLLEDDQPLREYYSLSLTQAHYQVVEADNSKDIVALIEQHNPALVITDLVMPDHDGLEGIFKMIGKYRIPVIVISAYPDFIELSKPLVAATYVKPLSASELIAAVDKMLHRSQPPAQANGAPSG